MLLQPPIALLHGRGNVDELTYMTDAELVQAARTGDTVALGELVERHWRGVQNDALTYLADRHEAEDVTQEAFMAALARLEQNACYPRMCARLIIFRCELLLGNADAAARAFATAHRDVVEHHRQWRDRLVCRSAAERRDSERVLRYSVGGMWYQFGVCTEPPRPCVGMPLSSWTRRRDAWKRYVGQQPEALETALSAYERAVELVPEWGSASLGLAALRLPLSRLTIGLGQFRGIREFRTCSGSEFSWRDSLGLSVRVRREPYSSIRASPCGCLLAALDRTGAIADAKDLAQETFVAALGDLSRLRVPARFGRWLYRIAARADCPVLIDDALGEKATGRP